MQPHRPSGGTPQSADVADRLNEMVGRERLKREALHHMASTMANDLGGR
jgi:hypothetical protein